MQPDEIAKYGQHFKEFDLWEKVAKFAKKVGREAIKNVLILYYTLQNPELPTKVRAVIYGAIGYFILPIDVLPDFIPVAGMSDDLAIVAAAIAYATRYITQREKDLAEAKVQQWFG